ncbi:hypothetical protein [Flaviflexus ciconiae]|nr:hypothetical protein [Flaviflexus ciconiae]
MQNTEDEHGEVEADEGREHGMRMPRLGLRGRGTAHAAAAVSAQSR